MPTTVVNMKRKNAKYDVYIGRGSKWGNPFVMKDWSDEERNRVCDEYVKLNKDIQIEKQPIFVGMTGFRVNNESGVYKISNDIDVIIVE